MSKKVFNPSDWLPKSKPSLNIYPNPKNPTNTNDEIEKITSRIESGSKDIAPTYEEWRNLGFALANAMGESGRHYYHRLSRFYHSYTAEETDKQFNKCLHSQSNGITIKTLFHLAKQAGVSLSTEKKTNQKHYNSSSTSQSNTCEESTQYDDIQENNNSRPTIALEIKSLLPELLQNILENAISPEDADLLLLGSLTVFSACLSNITGTYGGCDIYPNLFLFVTAQAGAGKGRLSLCRRLVAPIHNEIIEINKEEVKQYYKELAEYNQAKKESSSPPDQAKTKMLFIPANSSATAVFQILNNNNGIGLLFETEGDTLSQSFKSEHGNYSDALRKAFHHENISYLRRKENEYVMLDNPRLSTVLSGTPKQVRNLITSTENGLFSRFMFYYMNTKLIWNNVFQIGQNSQSYNNTFDNIGEDFFKLYKRLKASEKIKFTFTAAQKDKFNKFFEELQTSYYESHGIDFMATVRRLGIITYRIALILSALRLHEFKTIPTKIICKSKDFKAALEIALTLISHAEDVFQILPKTSNLTITQTAKNIEELLKILPNRFHRQQFITQAATIKIAARTADRHLKNFCQKGDIIKKSQGNYEKKYRIVSPIMIMDLDLDLI